MIFKFWKKQLNKGYSKGDKMNFWDLFKKDNSNLSIEEEVDFGLIGGKHQKIKGCKSLRDDEFIYDGEVYKSSNNKKFCIDNLC